jgi:hypothetical protein
MKTLTLEIQSYHVRWLTEIGTDRIWLYGTSLTSQPSRLALAGNGDESRVIPSADLDPKSERSILKQAGLSFMLVTSG